MAGGSHSSNAPYTNAAWNGEEISGEAKTRQEKRDTAESLVEVGGSAHYCPPSGEENARKAQPLRVSPAKISDQRGEDWR